MKFFRAILIASLAFLGSCNNQQEPEFLLRAALLVNEKHTWYQAFDHFSKRIEEKSKGRIQVEVYPSEQLGKESEVIRMIQSGVLEMTTTGSVLNNWIEIAAFCELPFLLKDSTEMKSFISGPIGQRLEREMLEVCGLRPLGYFQRGPRHLTSNRPIRHPDDLKGMILRVPNVPSFVTAWAAMGAKPTPMAFSEVFTSIQQGTIEGQENPFAMINSAGFAEVQDYLNLTSHVVSWIYPVIGEKQFQKLPSDLQKIFLECAEEMQAYEHQLFIANEKIVQKQLEEKGMEFIEVDQAAFAEACREAIYQSLSPEMQEVYQFIQDEKP